MPTITDTNTLTSARAKAGGHHDWRCTNCFALLGRRGEQGRVHLRTTRGVEYFATLPTTATCRCGRLNELHPALVRG